MTEVYGVAEFDLFYFEVLVLTVIYFSTMLMPMKLNCG